MASQMDRPLHDSSWTAAGEHRDLIRTRVWRNGNLEKEDIPFEAISEYLAQPDCLVWADLCDPCPERLASLADELSLDPHAIEDATSFHERPKASRYRTHVFLTAYALRHESGSDELTCIRVSAFGVPRGLFTIRLTDDFDINKVVQRWDDNGDLIKYGQKSLVHGLLDEMVDEYFEAIGGLDDTIEGLEDLLFEDTSQSTTAVQRKAYQARKSLLQARRAILPMREVVNTVMRRADDEHHELTPYFEDLYDHVLRASEWTESLRDMITSIFETNLSLADARLNSIMKKLTSWAAIIAVPTAITGFYGQNVPYPGFGHVWGFWFSVALMVGIGSALYVGFRKRDWL